MKRVYNVLIPIAAVLGTTALLSTALLSTPARADEYGFAGCGLGTKMFGPKNMQTSASTTNHGAAQVGSLPIPTSQVWSITLGIAGCEDEAKPVAYFQQYDYMFANFSSIARDAANGQGDSIDGLAASFGCNRDSYPAFGNFMKSQYEEIFSQPGIKAVFDEAQTRINENSYLLENCSALEGKAGVEVAAKD